MTTKRTEGPWIVNGSSITATWDTGEEVQLCLASTTQWCGGSLESRARNKRLSTETPGNLALIATAPELLLCLETIEAAMDGLKNGLAMEINRSARKAIAKAEGR